MNCEWLAARAAGLPIEDDLFNQPSKVLAHFRKARSPNLGQFVIFPHSATDLAKVAAQQFFLCQSVQQRIEASRADVIAEVTERLTQQPSVDRPLPGLLKHK